MTENKRSFDAFAALGSEKDKYEKAAEDLKFSESCKEKFNKFKEICADILKSAEALELVASVDFLLKTWYPNAGRSDILNLFKQHKTQFFDDQPIRDADIIKAFDICERLKQN